MSWLLVLAPVGWLCAAAGVAHVVGRRARRAEPVRVDVLVLLGARVLPDGRPSPALEARIAAAAQAFHAGRAPVVLITGGTHGGSGSATHTEARVAADGLRARGVPERALRLEEQATTTLENAQHAAPLLRALGATHVGLVTDDYHLARAAWWFRRAGFRVSGVPSVERLAAGTYARALVREAVALSRAVLQRGP